MPNHEHPGRWLIKPDAARHAMLSPRTATLRSNRRLQLVSLALAAITGTYWLTTNLVQGHLAEELRSVWQWGPPIVAVAASALMFTIARGTRIPSHWIIRAGLAYQVIISFTIVLGSTFTAYAGARVQDLTVDRVGLSWVIPWMIFFTVLVQAPVRAVVVALILSASAPGIGYGIEVAAARAPLLPGDQIFLLFVLPGVVGVAMTMIAANVVHELGLDVVRARELGSYRLETLLGKGGMGEVWRASHHTLARPAAIKLIRADALDSDPEQARLGAVRFEREAQAIASLQSRNTVQLYDFGVTQEGTLYYVMELLDGIDLEQLVRTKGPMPPNRTICILLQVCASLAEAHRRGVIHRDVKPANIYLCRQAFECDVVKVLDFGLARHITTSAAVGLGTETRSDHVIGTPAYLAPEAIRGDRDLDGRADLYALGCVAYWLMAGRMVFEGASAVALFAAHLERSPLPPSEVSPFHIPRELDEVVLQCLAKDASDRPANAETLAQTLRRVPLEAPWTPEDAVRWWNVHQATAAAVLT